MKITVLMSAYNGEKFIREQTDSILAQELPEGWELGVVVRDDGSSDGTVDILSDYARRFPEVFSFYSGENLGPCGSFLCLVATAPPSDLYAFADQDDVWFSEKLSRGIKALKNTPTGSEPAVYSSNVMVARADLTPVAPMRGETIPTDFAHVLIYNVSLGCTQVFNEAARREMVDYAAHKDVPVIMHDRLLDLLATTLGRIVYDPEPSMLYRQHGNNVVGQQSIGRMKNFFRRVKRFLGPSNSIRSERCRTILELYGDRVDDEKRRILRAVGFYKTNHAAKKTLLHDPVFRRGRRADFWFHLAVRMKKI